MDMGNRVRCSGSQHKYAPEELLAMGLAQRAQFCCTQATSAVLRKNVP